MSFVEIGCVCWHRMASLLTFLLSSVAFVISFEVQDDCLVKSSIERKNITFSSFEFLSFLRDDFPTTEVLMSCKTSGGRASPPTSSRLLYISPKNVTWKTSSNSIPSRVFPVPEGATGWTRLRLGLTKRLTLSDGEGKAWLPADLELGCDVQRVDVTSGRFTRGCPAGTPAWVVSSGAFVDVPLQERGFRDSKGALQESVILFSKEAFIPILRLAGGEFELGLRGGRLVTGGIVNPLPAIPHHFVFETFADGTHKTLKVFYGKHQVLSEPLQSTFASVAVSGGSRMMVIVQRLQEETEKTSCVADLGRSQANGATLWFLIGCLVVMAVLFIFILVYHHHYRQITQTQPTQARPPPSGPPIRKPPLPAAVDPAYLEPTPLPTHLRMQVAHARTSHAHEDLSIGRSSPEHEYEEVDEFFLNGTLR